MGLMWNKIIITILIFIISFFAQRLSFISIDKVVVTRDLKPARGKFVFRLFSLFNFTTVLILLVSIWGVSAESIWIFATSVLGIIAVSFFASWSFLSNIVATLILFINNPFKIDDEIIILPEEIQGVVIDIDGLFIILETEDATIHIPSNFLFQKMIKTLKKKAVVTDSSATADLENMIKTLEQDDTMAKAA